MNHPMDWDVPISHYVLVPTVAGDAKTIKWNGAELQVPFPFLVKF